jgi:transposase InsO family protein
MTDNGSCSLSRIFAGACRRLKHIRTRPYTPRTNGKAERFIQTLQREWAYAQPYPSSKPPHCCAAALAALLQRAPPARQPELITADQPSEERRMTNNLPRQQT